MEIGGVPVTFGAAFAQAYGKDSTLAALFVSNTSGSQLANVSISGQWLVWSLLVKLN